METYSIPSPGRQGYVFLLIIKIITMGRKALNTIKLTDTLSLSECTDGYWLYDYVRGMNLAMRAKTEQDAFVEALTYYQKRCIEIEEKSKKLHKAIDNFVEDLADNNDIYMPCDCDEY